MADESKRKANPTQSSVGKADNDILELDTVKGALKTAKALKGDQKKQHLAVNLVRQEFWTFF